MTDEPAPAPAPADPQPAGWRYHLPAVAGLAGLTAAFLWPAVVHFRDRVLSQGGDGSTFLWSYWYLPRTAFGGHNPFVTKGLFHPVGASLAFHTTTPLEAFVVWPITRLWGLGAAVNTLQLAAVLLSAVGAYLLALYVCGDRRAAFFAGAAFAFVPFRFVHMGGHFNLIHAEFLPFGILALLRLLDAPTRRRAVWLGVVVGLTFLTDFYLTVFLLVGLGVLTLVRRGEVDKRRIIRLAQAAAVAAIVALPVLIVMLSALRAGELDALPGWGGADVFSADVVSWLVPPERHPWWGSAFAGIRHGLPARGEGIAYPGLVVLALAIGGRELHNRSLRRSWVALAVVAGLLSLGPFLQVGDRTGAIFEYLGRDFAVPLPYFALHFVPVLNGVRVPGRFVILAALALVVLAAVALAGLARDRPRWANVIMAGALVVTLVEFLPGHLDQHPTAVPRPYHRIAADPDPGAVMEIPLQWQSGTAAVGDTKPQRDDTIFLYYATTHGKPLVSGYLARYSDQRLARLTAIPLYRQVLALGREPGYSDPVTFNAADLQELGIGFVVYHRDRPWPAAFEYFSRLGLRTLDDDGTIIAWKVVP